MGSKGPGDEHKDDKPAGIDKYINAADLTQVPGITDAEWFSHVFSDWLVMD